jgi:hypothetical protein
MFQAQKRPAILSQALGLSGVIILLYGLKGNFLQDLFTVFLLHIQLGAVIAIPGF